MGFAEVLITLCVVALILLILLVIGFVVVMNSGRAGVSGAGPASGDLSGQYPGPRVTGLQGLPVSATDPSDGQVMVWNASLGAWQPRSVVPGMLEPPPPVEPEELDLNTATAEELTTIPGVGPGLAERIVEAREAQGGFASFDDLLEVRGVGQALLERIKDSLKLSG